MKVFGIRLCCMISMIILSLSIVAQTTVKKEVTSVRISVQSQNYVPYGSSVRPSSSTDTSYSGDYQRKSAPSNGVTQTKKTRYIVIDTLSIHPTTTDVNRRDEYVSKLERRAFVDKNDTIAVKRFPKQVDLLKNEVADANVPEVTANKTLPLSHFQQSGTIK